MTGLETAFYIIGIIFMSLVLLIMAGIAVAVIKLTKKVNALHQTIDDKISKFTDIAQKSSTVIGTLKKAAAKTKR